MRFVPGVLAAAAIFGLNSAAQATVQVEVDLAAQTMHVSSSTGEYDWPISSGKPGHRTPAGVFRPQRMYVMIHSRKYDDAPMPHAIFFDGGYAIHGTYATGALGRVASHGCIRLAPQNAAELFDMVRREGARIVVTGQAPGAEIASAEPTGRRAARPSRRERSDSLAYAPQRLRVRSLREWADNPLENQ